MALHSPHRPRVAGASHHLKSQHTRWSLPRPNHRSVRPTSPSSRPCCFSAAGSPSSANTVTPSNPGIVPGIPYFVTIHVQPHSPRLLLFVSKPLHNVPLRTRTRLCSDADPQKPQPLKRLIARLWAMGHGITRRRVRDATRPSTYVRRFILLQSRSFSGKWPGNSFGIFPLTSLHKPWLPPCGEGDFWKRPGAWLAAMRQGMRTVNGISHGCVNDCFIDTDTQDNDKRSYSLRTQKKVHYAVLRGWSNDWNPTSRRTYNSSTSPFSSYPINWHTDAKCARCHALDSHHRLMAGIRRRASVLLDVDLTESASLVRRVPRTGPPTPGLLEFTREGYQVVDASAARTLELANTVRRITSRLRSVRGAPNGAAQVSLSGSLDSWKLSTARVSKLARGETLLLLSRNGGKPRVRSLSQGKTKIRPRDIQ